LSGGKSDTMTRSYREICAVHGTEDVDNSWHYDPASAMLPALAEFGVSLNLPESILARPGRIFRANNGAITIGIARLEGDSSIAGFIADRKWHRKVTGSRPPLESTGLDWVRYVNTAGDNNSRTMVPVGLFCRDDFDRWFPITLSLLRCVFDRRGIPKREIDPAIGGVLADPLELVHIPFQPEYPGGKKWNLGAPQFSYQPSTGGPHPTWDAVLSHCGQDLDAALQNLDWAKAANITTGGQYLLHWAACMLREPYQKLPYLFFWGDQNGGKSTYWESVDLLMTGGVGSADRALTNSNDFNGELANAVLAVVEEKDVAKTPGAYNKLKDWVTSPKIWIRKMRTDAYPQVNTLHFVQTANEKSACPIFPGDTRITMFFVPPLKSEIPKDLLTARLRQEAPHFMHTIMDLELPPIISRLRLPVVNTDGKLATADESVAEFPAEVAALMANRREWIGTAADLAIALGPGEWPRDRRAARAQLERAGAFLRGRGITVEYLPKVVHGYPIKVVRNG
jgi:hypothetical protein